MLTINHLAMRPFLATCLGLISLSAQADDWVSLFDGKTTNSWQANEKQECFTVENGELKLNGGMAHMFCVKDGYEDLKNFEFKADVKTLPFANSGIFFHTENRGPGGIKKGYEAQIDYTEDAKPTRKKGREERLLSHGAIAIHM